MKADRLEIVRTGFALLFLSLYLLLLPSCHKTITFQRTDEVRQNPPTGAQIRSVKFVSTSLQRPAHYLIVLPPEYRSSPAIRFPVLFLLHGMDGTSADWIDKGNIASLPLHKLILVMPDGADSYYTNAALRSQDRYEDFIAKDLVQDVEQHYRIGTRPNARGIAGISMGGYGAIKVALKHPGLFAFAGSVSGALDAPRWPFSAKRIGQSFRLLRIFGAWGGSARRANDVFLWARESHPNTYFYLACGTDESLLEVNRRFVVLLEKQGIAHEYHESTGGHSWDHWQSELPALLDAAQKHLNGD